MKLFIGNSYQREIQIVIHCVYTLCALSHKPHFGILLAKCTENKIHLDEHELV